MSVSKTLQEIKDTLVYNKVKKEDRPEMIKTLHKFGIKLTKKKKTE